MKRLLLLLLVLAVGVTIAAITVPRDAAKVDGTAISRSSLNGDVNAIVSSADYQCYLNSQQYLSSGGTSALPPVTFAGQGQNPGEHSTASSAFVATYLDTEIGHQLLLNAAHQADVTVTPGQLAQARSQLVAQISSVMTQILQTPEAQNPSFSCSVSGQPLSGAEVLATLPSSFVDRQAMFDATASVWQEDLAGVGSSEADLRGYYGRHSGSFDTTCFTAAAYQTQAAATAARAQVVSGTPFSQVAAQATQGGPQGCPVLSALSAQLPSGSGIEQLPTGVVSQPIALGGTYFLLQITSRTPTPYATAKQYVSAAVQHAGAAAAQRAVTAAARRASVTVDPQYGTWHGTSAAVFPPVIPNPSDVLNAPANDVTTSATSAASAGSSGG